MEKYVTFGEQKIPATLYDGDFSILFKIFCLLEIYLIGEWIVSYPISLIAENQIVFRVIKRNINMLGNNRFFRFGQSGNAVGQTCGILEAI